MAMLQWEWQSNILNSIANEENALGELIHREAGRTLDSATDSTIGNILRVSCAERKLLQTIIAKEIILLFKLDETITCPGIPCTPCAVCNCCLDGTSSGIISDPSTGVFQGGTATVNATCTNGIITALTYTAENVLNGNNTKKLEMMAITNTIKFDTCSKNALVITGSQTTTRTEGSPEGNASQTEQGTFTLTVIADPVSHLVTSFEIVIAPDSPGAQATKHDSGLVTVAEGGTLKVEYQ